MIYEFLFSKNKYQTYGINFGYKMSIVKLNQLAHRMIKNCDRWKANWEKVLEEITPEVQKQLKIEIDNIRRKLSEEEFNIFIEKVKQLKKEKENE